ncbi:hypothetical protein EW146_g3730 [Bondarzewia mesenterica]|uniref:Uncharacterized protein n=1 Tax=Bondarzewia mesenterica TaxID=1095465 RepID=A0A4V3XFC4_9AGAM|nr:hypothetical protein EW146_g3730 [Bondarzewia mesenterica]
MRAILFAVHAMSVALLLGSPFGSPQVLAKPIPMPMPLTDHRARSLSNLPVKIRTSKALHDSNSSISSDHTRRLRGIDNNSDIKNVMLLKDFSDKASGNAENIKTCSSEAEFGGDRGSDFADRCTSEVKAFRSNLLGFQDVLADLGRDKGLANYDPDNELETLLKNIVNLNKEVLKDVDILIYSLPIVGPILGPIVYEVKCILIDVLDAVENLTDAILNAIRPLLGPFIEGYSLTTSCKSGIQLSGLCL